MRVVVGHAELIAATTALDARNRFDFECERLETCVLNQALKAESKRIGVNTGQFPDPDPNFADVQAWMARSLRLDTVENGGRYS